MLKGGAGRMEEGVVLSDAHTHIGTEDERLEREAEGIVSLVCASTPREAGEIFSHRGRYLIPTCGVHPWYVKERGLGSMEPWMGRCPVIGEIGMDSVWCSVPLDLQEDVFRRQLGMACCQKKPVILHTKGQEEEIARIIREYPNRYLVHWYSCEKYLEEYLDQDCYFSIGPDVWWNQTVMEVVRKVPGNRLLLETDGLEAVKWAYEEGRKVCGRRPMPMGTPEHGLMVKAGGGKDTMEGEGAGAAWALMATLRTVAGILGISAKEAGRMFRENLVTGFLAGLDTGIMDYSGMGKGYNVGK